MTHRSAAWWVALAALCFSVAVRAEPPESSPEFERATQLFRDGSELFLQKRHAEALALLERSYRLYPSPNSLLLIARSERELGKLEDAARHFAETASAAEARVSRGERQYVRTARAARSEGAAVRRSLGTLRIRVHGAPEGARVETPHVRALLPSDGSLELVHRAGTIRVGVRLADGRSAERTVTVTAGSFTDVELTLPRSAAKSSAPARRSPPAPVSERSNEEPAGWMVPTGIALAGVGAAGVVSFAFFGARSRATYSDLESECGGSCNTAAQRRRADDGERDQTIANVSLAIGAVALAAGITLFVLASGDERPRSALLEPIRF